jgi:2-amino-4-hydroxy-6-hydroxymethyldihydropteridine diphosphokinase
VAASSVYETDPVGGPADQGPFLNCVIQLDTDRTARELLGAAAAAEAAAGRVRTVHWGPRTLDVDVLWIDGVVVAEPDLVVPHPRLWERAFVLVPLAELAPDVATPERLAAVAGDVAGVRTAGRL